MHEVLLPHILMCKCANVFVLPQSCYGTKTNLRFYMIKLYNSSSKFSLFPSRTKVRSCARINNELFNITDSSHAGMLHVKSSQGVWSQRVVKARETRSIVNLHGITATLADKSLSYAVAGPSVILLLGGC